MFTGIIGTVVQDAIIYFALIFASHLTLAMFIFFTKVHYIAVSFGTCDRFLRILYFLVITGNYEVTARTVSWRVLVNDPSV